MVVFFIYPKKFGFINLSITPENHNNSIVTATFVSIDFAVLGSSEDRLIQATITNIKHTTKINVITIFVRAHIITGNTSVEVVAQSDFLVDIQSHIIGNFVLSLIPSHFFSGVTTTSFKAHQSIGSHPFLHSSSPHIQYCHHTKNVHNQINR